ncbi:MAG: GNAT family N-acetyltransferase [Urechidicola sp.]|nr:GNAT family N-acetyltransferase [Urechidicola sp.]
MIEIKPATSQPDFEIISQLAFIIWEEHYTKIIGSAQVTYMLNKYQTVSSIENQVVEGYQYHLVYADKIPVGYLSFIKKEQSLFLSKIYVLNSERGKGIGKFMMDFLQQKAIENNLHSISLTVNKQNTVAIKAYKKMGFIRTDSIITDIGQGFMMDDFKMVKEI